MVKEFVAGREPLGSTAALSVAAYPVEQQQDKASPLQICGTGLSLLLKFIVEQSPEILSKGRGHSHV